MFFLFFSPDSFWKKVELVILLLMLYVLEFLLEPGQEIL